MLTVDEFERFAGQVRAEFGQGLPSGVSAPTSPDFALEFLPDADLDIPAQIFGTFDGVALGAHLLHDGELLLCLNTLGTTDSLCWSSFSGTSASGQGTALSPILRRLFVCLVRASYSGQLRAGTFPRPQ